MPRISVTLPAYNAEATVAACLDSLLSQTCADFEIIAVDDGSTDSTADILREYARRDDRVCPLFLEHGGVAHAANAAMDAARGRYIARMDADDLALPERLAAQARLLDEHAGTGLVGCRVRFGGDRSAAGGYAHYVDWTNTLLSSEDIALNRFVELPVPNPSIMFRRDVVDTHGGYLHGDFPEDYDLRLRWLEQGVSMEKVDEELLVWNDPPTRLTRTDTRYDVDAFYRTKTGYLARWLVEHNPAYPVVGVLGAGRTTRKRSDLLMEHNIRIDRYFDVDPRKVGHVVHGVPVVSRETVPKPGELFLLSYVGSRGAREDIAEFLAGRGYVLGRDWIAVA